MRPPVLRLHGEELIVDNFAGGGGASLGIEWATGRSPDIAINHNAVALAIHKANHPLTRHLCEDVFDVDPRKACGGRPIALAWFSPDCTFHSRARGGKPFRDRDKARRKRGLAGVVIRWAKLPRPQKPRVICLENVQEFEDWGPLGEDGKPDPERKGFNFRRWWAQLVGAGYQVEMRQLRACDYGAPTTRKRLFIIARSDGRRIVWPAPTHGPGREPYRNAADCIDFELPVRSIFGRKRPLKENTLRRIARGLKRFVLECPEPFIIPVKTWGGGGNEPRSIDEPMRTTTTSKRGEYALVEPFLVRTAHGEADSTGKKRGRGEHSLEEPLPTQLTTNDFALTAAHLARIGQTNGNGGYVNDVRDPLTTVTTKAEHMLVAAGMIHRGNGEREGQAPRIYDIEDPHPTVVASGVKTGLVAAFLAKHFGGHETPGAPLQLSMPTVTARDHHALVASHMLKLRGGLEDHQVTAQDWRSPAPTLTAGGYHLAEVRAFLLAYYSTGDQDGQLKLPMHTVTTKARFGLVTVHGHEYVIVDIGMRMLVPRELFNAQSFPSSYVIAPEVDGKPITKEQQVDACGNAVPPRMAEALVRAQFSEQEEAALG